MLAVQVTKLDSVILYLILNEGLGFREENKEILHPRNKIPLLIGLCFAHAGTTLSSETTSVKLHTLVVSDQLWVSYHHFPSEPSLEEGCECFC